MTRVLAAIAALLVSSTAFAQPPGGRLTLVANDPGVPAAPVLNKSTIYYACDSGNTVPIRVSGAFMDVPINGCQLTLNLSTSTNTGFNYDIFAVYRNGVAVVCHLDVAWKMGLRSSNLVIHYIPATTNVLYFYNDLGQKVNYTNLNNCWNGSTNYGPIAASEGTYLGTWLATAPGQTSMAMQPTSIEGGNNTVCGVYNAYNQRLTTCRSNDSGRDIYGNGGFMGWVSRDASTSPTHLWPCDTDGPGGGRNNRVNWPDGWGDKEYRIESHQVVGPWDLQAPGGSAGGTSVGLSWQQADPDNVTWFFGSDLIMMDQIGVPSNLPPGFSQRSMGIHVGPGNIGKNYAQCLDGGINVAVYGNGAGRGFNTLIVQAWM